MTGSVDKIPEVHNHIKANDQYQSSSSRISESLLLDNFMSRSKERKSDQTTFDDNN